MDPAPLRSDVDVNDAVAIAADTADARSSFCGRNDRALGNARHPDIGGKTFAMQ
jgi:hypothetical protein